MPLERPLLLASALLLACGASSPPPASVTAAAPLTEGASAPDPASVERVPANVVHERVASGQALFVCAYDDARCARFPLEGSIPWSALQVRLPQLRLDQEIILFCD